ncbi:nuclear envelope phosphatase-regulatory subunit 1-like isoform X2 [Homarus americanus]|uniref:nuclear envelope phosphatase-regulatory subunit 1-like isoform X2 n=1 Tax=Homarus americanus TaxID=6706 RepID=UPI001C43E7C5|nr:nuclear envelope phosphatase-regulatory subunit 1-like isoform X2 [Homarus americanus]
MSLEQTACEDLKAFERRLTEVIARLQPATTRWRMILVFVAASTALGAYLWLTDPITQDASFVQSLLNHLFFTFAASALINLSALQHALHSPQTNVCVTSLVVFS